MTTTLEKLANMKNTTTIIDILSFALFLCANSTNSVANAATGGGSASDAAAVYQRGWQLAKKGDATGAADAYETAAAGGHLAARYNLARAYYTGSGRAKDFSKTKTLLEEIIAQDATGATAAVTESNKKLQKSAADWLAQIARWEKARDEALLAKKIKKNDAGAVRSNSEKKVPVTVVRPNWFIGVGVGGELASWSGDAKGGFLPGAVFTGGAYLSSDKKSFWRNVSLYGDIGFFIGSWNDTVTYSESYGDALGLGAYNGWTERAWQSRKSEQLSIPVLATLAYNFSFGKSADGGERFNLRVGPSLGVIYVSMKSKFGDGTLLGIYDPDGNRRASITGVEPPQDTNQSGSKVLLTYGVSIGASWNLARRWTLDLAYRFHATTALDLGAGRNYGQSTNHQFTFGANWRF